MCYGNAASLAKLRQSRQLLHHIYPQRITRVSHASLIGARAMATSGEGGAIQKRAVAGSFIFTIPDGDHKQAKVALFRRSSKVRTYQHKLAPCSGSVESDDASPLAAALREIQEETTLPASSIELLRVGKPYSFIDESIGREWSINPFAFRLKGTAEGGKGEEGITLDWEHEGIEWYDPMQVNGSDGFGGVPRLIDSLRRVWPEYDLGSEAGRILAEGLRRLRDDHENGARELAGIAVSTLRDVIRPMSASGPIDESWWAKVRMAAWHICQSRPSMGVSITSATVKALDAIRAAYITNVAAADKIQQMIQALDQHLAHRGSAIDRISRSFTDYVRQNIVRVGEPKDAISILTVSSSSTVSSCLLHAASTLGIAIDLRILESRPLCEGVTLASRVLSSHPHGSHVKVTLYSDASAAIAARGVDIVLIGADRISSAGDVNNKIGSLPAILSTRYTTPTVKVLVLSDTEKVAGPGSMEGYVLEDNSPLELSQAWKGVVPGAQTVQDALSRGDPVVTVKNTYFEWVPAELIDAYVTEEGLWDAEQIKHQSKRAGNEAEHYFKGL